MNLFISFFTICVFFQNVTANDTNETESGYEPETRYEEEGIIFADENGILHYLDYNVTNIPDDNRGILLGNIYYYIFSRDKEENKEELEMQGDPPVIKSKIYNQLKKTKIITHGWLSSADTDSVINIRDAYLLSSDHNVITVDWSEISRNPLYPVAAASTRCVGKDVAKLVNALIDNFNISGRDVHLIGHSLGAQVMGTAGSFINENVSRITGLDPARPLFEFPYFAKTFSLEDTDAEFVDIIHTCAGVLGYENDHGHADFYPNDGHPSQPGCEGIQPILQACSHGRAYKFFAESIYNTDPKFISYRAESWRAFKGSNQSTDTVVMGDHVSTVARGRYYLYTAADSKYAKGNCQSKCGEDCCEGS